MRFFLIMVISLILNKTCSFRSSNSRKMLFKGISMQQHTSRDIERTVTVTGAFKKELPDVFVASTHHRRALRSLKDIKQDMTIKNYRNRRRKFAAQTMDQLMKGLTVPLTTILKSYKRTLSNLHPYESTVADLTLTARVKAGQPDLNDILKQIKSLRAETSKIAKHYASKAKIAASATEADELLEEGMQLLEQLYSDSNDYNTFDEILALENDNNDNDNDDMDNDNDDNDNDIISIDMIDNNNNNDIEKNISPANALAELVEIQKELRRIPVIELATPTVVLVGAPNVGKSSIVRAVSSGTPEVNNYPFTTRGVTIGHISDENRGLRFQVMDTPGLLDRPEDERNEMERLTFASLAHLPTAVIFVIDASGLSGERLSSVEAQLNVRNYLRSRFPRRPWLDIVSKADLKDTIDESILNSMPQDYLHISTEDGTNVQILQDSIEGMMNELKIMLIEMQQAKE